MAAMGVMGGIFAPDDMRKWPAVDKSDPGYIRDLEGAPLPARQPAPGKMP
jgi:hypothetical protein